MNCPRCNADLRVQWSKDGESIDMLTTCRCELSQQEMQTLVNEWIHGANEEEYTETFEL